jgi:hypothetical protein
MLDLVYYHKQGEDRVDGSQDITYRLLSSSVTDVACYVLEAILDYFRSGIHIFYLCNNTLIYLYESQ